MNLEDLLSKAANATSPPPIPSEGLPNQRLWPCLRWVIRILSLPLLQLELQAEKLAKLFIRPPFLQEGRCKRRGNCCHYILFPELKGALKKIFLFWYTEVHGFYKREGLESEVDGKKIHVYGCRHLRKDGSCANYRFRPKVCRSWPLIDCFGYPKVLKGCGYQIKLRPSYKKKYPGLKMYESDKD